MNLDGFPPDDDEATTLDIVLAIIGMVCMLVLAIQIIKDVIK